MSSIATLRDLLEHQYGPFIRDSKYSKAFDQALQILQSLDELPSNHDQFYLFLHVLVIKLFEEIEQLHAEISNLKNQRNQ